jgi:hypothetical protein
LVVGNLVGFVPAIMLSALGELTSADSIQIYRHAKSIEQYRTLLPNLSDVAHVPVHGTGNKKV